MNFGSKPRSSPEINLTSLIDLLFIVLVFLVLTTTFRESTTLRIALPEAATGERAGASPLDVLSIAIDRSEQIYLRREPILLEQLESRLREIVGEREPDVVLTADARVPHGRVVAVIDRIRRTGIRRLRIETVQPNERRDP